MVNMTVDAAVMLLDQGSWMQEVLQGTPTYQANLIQLLQWSCMSTRQAPPSRTVEMLENKCGDAGMMAVTQRSSA
jgi:hypothetical protein